MSTRTWHFRDWEVTCVTAEAYPYGPHGYLFPAPEQWTLLATFPGAPQAQALMYALDGWAGATGIAGWTRSGVRYQVRAVISPEAARKIIDGCHPLDVLAPSMTVRALSELELMAR